MIDCLHVLTLLFTDMCAMVKVAVLVRVTALETEAAFGGNKSIMTQKKSGQLLL